MDSLLRRAALICATFVFTAFAPPVSAQQTTPDSPPQSVPPAPPPDLRNPDAPTAAAPRHRWVNTGGYLSLEPRRKSATRSTTRRQTVTETAHSKKARRVAKSEVRGTRGLTKAELRRCKSLSKRQLKRNSTCQAALSAKPKAANREKPARALSKAETRRCQKMSYSQLLRNRDCAALLQRELAAGDRSKHRSTPDKASSRHKADSSRQVRKKSSKRRRS